jgi:hypothetical protein
MDGDEEQNLIAVRRAEDRVDAGPASYIVVQLVHPLERLGALTIERENRLGEGGVAARRDHSRRRGYGSRTPCAACFDEKFALWIQECGIGRCGVLEETEHGGFGEGDVLDGLKNRPAAGGRLSSRGLFTHAFQSLRDGGRAAIE